MAALTSDALLVHTLPSSLPRSLPSSLPHSLTHSLAPSCSIVSHQVPTLGPPRPRETEPLSPHPVSNAQTVVREMDQLARNAWRPSNAPQQGCRGARPWAALKAYSRHVHRVPLPHTCITGDRLGGHPIKTQATDWGGGGFWIGAALVVCSTVHLCVSVCSSLYVRVSADNSGHGLHSA